METILFLVDLLKTNADIFNNAFVGTIIGAYISHKFTMQIEKQKSKDKHKAAVQIIIDDLETNINQLRSIINREIEEPFVINTKFWDKNKITLAENAPVEATLYAKWIRSLKYPQRDMFNKVCYVTVRDNGKSLLNTLEQSQK